jgi:hypothetical protein
VKLDIIELSKALKIFGINLTMKVINDEWASTTIKINRNSQKYHRHSFLRNHKKHFIFEILAGNIIYNIRRKLKKFIHPNTIFTKLELTPNLKFLSFPI